MLLVYFIYIKYILYSYPVKSVHSYWYIVTVDNLINISVNRLNVFFFVTLLLSSFVIYKLFKGSNKYLKISKYNNLI